MGPLTLDQAMDHASRAEEKIRVVKGPKNFQFTSPKGGGTWGAQTKSYLTQTNPTNPTKPYPSHTNPNWTPSSSHNPTTNTYPQNPKPTREIRRLTERELEEKKEKGLCFRCDEKWTIGHRCRRRELSVMITFEGDDDEGEIKGAETEEEEPEVDSHPPEVSLNSVIGITNPKTMKLLGEIKGV